MISDFKILGRFFLRAFFLIIPLKCIAAESITRDRGGWEKTTITHPAEQAARAHDKNYITRKETVTFNVQAKLDFSSDTYTTSTSFPVVQSWEESNARASISGLTSELIKHMREVRIAHYTASLIDIDTARPFNDGEKDILKELINRVSTT